VFCGEFIAKRLGQAVEAVRAAIVGEAFRTTHRDELVSAALGGPPRVPFRAALHTQTKL
jgi:hypothetical protein